MVSMRSSPGLRVASAPPALDVWRVMERTCYGRAFIQADVTRATDVQRMLDMAYDRWGRLDVLFNNPGIAQVRQLLELTEDDWDRTLAVNLRAVFFVLQGAAKRMRHQAPIAASELRGKLIQTASLSAYRGGPAHMAHYAASKAGVVG